MSKAKKRRIEKESAKLAVEQSRNQAAESAWQTRRVIIIVTAVFLALILLIVGINHYFSEDQKYYRIDIITVDGITIGMNEFVKRCDAAGSDPMNMLSSITRELVIKLEAEELGWTVTQQEIDESLMEQARGTAETISRSEFQEWYRQRLNETRLSDEIYRDATATSILAERFFETISRSAPTVAEQVHLQLILVDTEQNAQKLKARWEAGESFADLAKEASLDASSRDNGGDMGWIPRGVVYQSQLDETAFGLEIGRISEPIPYYNSTTPDDATQTYMNYILLMVTEKADAREIDQQYMEAVYNQAFEDWLSQVYSNHTIKYSGIRNGFDSETYSWINWQLQKRVGSSK